MKRFLVASLWCLLIAACASQQAIATHMPSMTTTAEQDSTETPSPIGVETLMAISTYFPKRVDILPGLWALDSKRFQFIRSRVSFILPESWDILTMISKFNQTNKLDTHTIYRNSTERNSGNNNIPTIKFIFEPVLVGMDSQEYFVNAIAQNSLCKIDDVFQKGNGVLNLDAAIGYKCSYMDGNIQRTMYEIYFTSNFGYETTGVQIIMDSPSNAFSNVDSEFVEFMKSLSITY